MEKKNIHKDHRQRVRARYLNEGIGSMAEHNVLEMLLFFGIPYKDTNLIAHELIDTFGSFDAVLNAPVEELMKVKGVGENAATLIRLTRDISIKYMNGTPNNATKAETKFMDFIKDKYKTETRELVYLVSINSNGEVEHCTKVSDGSPDSAQIDMRNVMEIVLRFNSKAVVLAHNHPHGFAAPSNTDVRTTEQLKAVLGAVGVSLADHVIVSPDDIFSMAQHHKFAYLF